MINETGNGCKNSIVLFLEIQLWWCLVARGYFIVGSLTHPNVCVELHVIFFSPPQVQQYKQDPKPSKCLHSIFNVHTGDEVFSHEEYGHLQVRNNGVFLKTKTKKSTTEPEWVWIFPSCCLVKGYRSFLKCLQLWSLTNWFSCFNLPTIAGCFGVWFVAL